PYVSCILTPTTQFSTLSLHDALPISLLGARVLAFRRRGACRLVRLLAGFGQCDLADGTDGVAPRLAVDAVARRPGLVACLGDAEDRKSTRLNSSHVKISYAVFCLKKK